MKKLEQRIFEAEQIEIRAAEEGKPAIVTGYAALFEKLSLPLYGFREKIRAGAFASSIRERNVKALWNHNSDMPLASTKNDTLKLEEDELGLRFEMELPATSWGADAEVSIRRGDTDGVSFGFVTLVDEWDNSDRQNPIRTLVDVELHEISPTPFPAYPQTSLKVRTAEEVYNEYLAAKSQETGAADEAERAKIAQESAERDRDIQLWSLL